MLMSKMHCEASSDQMSTVCWSDVNVGTIASALTLPLNCANEDTRHLLNPGASDKQNVWQFSFTFGPKTQSDFGKCCQEIMGCPQNHMEAQILLQIKVFGPEENAR